MPQAAERIGVESYFGVSNFTRNAGVYDAQLRKLVGKTRDYSRGVDRATDLADASWTDSTRHLAKMVDSQQAEINDLRTTLQRYVNDSNRGVRRAGTGFQDFSQSVIGQVMRMRAILDGGRMMVQAFLRPFQQFIAIGAAGAGMDRMNKMFLRMTGSQEAYNKALNAMREATMGTVSDVDLVSQSLKIMNLGLADTAENAAIVTRNVTLLARMAGQVPSPESAMQVFAMMMANQSKLRLDAFGLSVGEVNRRIEQLKDTLGVSPEEAFRIAVYDLMNEKVESMGLAVETAETKASRMQATFKNMADSMKMMIVPEFDDFITILSRWAQSFTDNASKIEAFYVKFVAVSRAAISVVGDYVSVLIFRFLALTNAMKGNTEAMEHFRGLADEITANLVSQASFYDIYEAEVRKHYEGMAVSAEDSAARQREAQRAAVEEAAAAVAAVRAEWDEKMAAATQAAESKMAAITIRETYKAMDAAIAAQRKREDAVRQTAARIEQIEQQLAASMSKAMSTYHSTVENAERQHAARMAQIEEQYQRTLKDIQRRYEMEEWEAIESRDATALLKAKRRRDDDTTRAREQRDQQNEEAQRAYEEQLRAAKEALQRQLQAAREAYRQQVAALQQQLKDQEEQQKLSDERKAEDQERARARERGRILQAQGQAIAELYLHYSAEYSAAQEHHRQMLGELDRYIAAYAARMQALARYYGYGGGGTIGMQHGGTFVATAPTTIRVAEGGKPELVHVQPLRGEGAGGGGPSTMQHSVSGTVQAQVSATIERSMDGFEGRLEAAMSEVIGNVFGRLQ